MQLEYYCYHFYQLLLFAVFKITQFLMREKRAFLDLSQSPVSNFLFSFLCGHL